MLIHWLLMHWCNSSYEMRIFLRERKNFNSLPIPSGEYQIENSYIARNKRLIVLWSLINMLSENRFLLICFVASLIGFLINGIWWCISALLNILG